ncbi:MAG: OmpH family outer membrane protein [Chloroflexi bacterium]|nr:OmpH family outer membrane protein [Chloroflexota bacterium]
MSSLIVQDIVQDDDGVAIWCPELEVFTCGESLEQARERLREALYEYYLFLLVHYHHLPDQCTAHWRYLQELLPFRMLSTLPGDTQAEVLRGLLEMALISSEDGSHCSGFLRVSRAFRQLGADHPLLLRQIFGEGERAYGQKTMEAKPLYRDLYFVMINVIDEEGHKFEAKRRALENRLANLTAERQRLEQDLQKVDEQYQKYANQLHELERRKTAFGSLGGAGYPPHI